jgi:hypothetical protein
MDAAFWRMIFFGAIFIMLAGHLIWRMAHG